MPTYDYRCRDCDHEMEVQQAFSDDPLSICPQCGGSLRKVFSAVGISFKGSGFYKTDSRGSKSSSSTGSSSSTSASSGSTDSSSTSTSTSPDGGSTPSSSTASTSSTAGAAGS